MTSTTHREPSETRRELPDQVSEGSTRPRSLKESKEGSTHKGTVDMPPARTGSLERDRAPVKNFSKISDRGDKEIKESLEKIVPKILDLQAGGELPVWAQVTINNAIWGNHRI